MVGEVLEFGVGVHFGLVGWLVALIGNNDKLASGESLSTNKLHRLKNNFPLFACHARNPSNHKAFRLFQARKLYGKNFRPGHQSGDQQQESNASKPGGTD